MKGQSYTVSDIEKLYIQLCNQKGNPNIITFKEQLTSISRILVWDDQHNSDLFDFLCEVKMLETLLQIFGSTRDKEVVNAILSFFTILLSNLTRQPSVNYLLSHSVMGCLTLTKFGNMNNEIADYYINFLKVLSRKITAQNLHLFYNERYPTFPILSQTIRFFNHPESLVRTTCRNIILTLAKIKSPLVHSFMANFPFATYYIHESNFLKEYWAIADRIIRDKEDNFYELAHLEQLFQDHEQILIFLDDLLNLQQPGMAECFVSAFINECLSPLVHSLDTEAKECFSIQIALYILIVLFKTFTHPFVADILTFIFFGKYHTKKLAESLFEPVPCLLSYDKKWKFKGFWDSHEDKVRMHCSQLYSKFSEKTVVSDKNNESFISNIVNKVDTSVVFGITNNFYEREIEKVQTIFGFNILNKQQQHPRLGSGHHLQTIFKQIQEKGFDIAECQINSISGTIQSYLISKDDTLVLLTLTLFSAVYNNRSISFPVFNYCRLATKPENKDFQSIIKIEKLIINCIKIFSVDPPCFRMCTYVQSFELIKKLANFYKNNELQLSADVLNCLKAGLKLSIDRITPYLYSGKQWQKVISMYVQVVKHYGKRRFKTLKSFGFLPSEENTNTNVNLATDYIFQNYPKEFHHQIARDFWIYFLIRDLFLNFNATYSLWKLDDPKEKVQSFKYDVGKTYHDVDDQVILLQYRLKLQQKYIPCQLILMMGYFVLLENSVVTRRVGYDELIALSDRSDPRKLFLSGEGQTIWLQLTNASTAQALLLHLQEGRSVLMRYKLSQIVKEVQIYRECCS